ncbi:enzyme activator [Histoplasma capsulatum]|uniref:Enzyme activator n=1 Tax=Ajellomyces capsulatus TaxID=5037 RepID=A0A8A1M9H2_AJECA|nr:enzyme activator [Histoplasma capsulatum]
MAYPQRGVPPHRQYNDRPPPPQNYGYQSRGRGGYGPGPRNPNYDNRRQYHDERGGYGGGGGQRGRGFHDPYLPPNRGRGGPPPDRHGYGERRPMNGPPPGPPPGQLPPNFDKSFPRPPPLQNRPRHPNDAPPLSPTHAGGTPFDNPFPAFPRRRMSSDEFDKRMGALDLNDSTMRPPEQRPHTSNSNRPPRQRPDEMPPWGGAPGGKNMPHQTDVEPPMGPKRSATMPLSQNSAGPQYPGQQPWQEPPMPAPVTAGDQNPNIVPYSEGDSVDNGKDLPDDFLDAYLGANGPRESDMPNFSAMSDAPDDNIVPVDKPGVNGLSTSNTGNGYTAYRPGAPASSDASHAPANQFENAGFQFDLPPSPGAAYDQQRRVDEYGPPSAGAYSHRQPTGGMAAGPAYHGDSGGGIGGYGSRPPPKRYSPPGQGAHMQYPGDQTAYQNQPGGVSLADNPSQNPDMLPRHPAPFRLGLEQGVKPPPIRQYDNPPPMPPQGQSGQGRAPPPPQSRDRPTSEPLTFEELNRIQQTAKNNPSDHKAQLFLAKKLVEASVVLVDDNGRADLRTKNKNRERYIFDAHKIAKKLVSAGYPPAMFYLADCYGEGQLGLEVDQREAFSLYQSAAKAGHPESAYRLAVCCEMGYEGGGGTKRDPMKAVQWYRRAAALGDTPAMYKMGMILLKGLLGQQKNPREGVSWLKRAAERADESNPHALHELALLYENPNGIDAIIQDEAYSLELLEQAAELGYKFSQYRLGIAYEHGLLGCPVDPRTSIMWYSQAAAQGEHQAELSLSGWYLTGAEGILQQSDTEAYLWARKAALAGLAKAEYAMGYFTEVGIGVTANLEDAKRWYWKASSQNFMKARERLEDLKRGGAKMQKTRVSRSAVNNQNQGDCIVM